MVSNAILSPSAFSACGSNSWRSRVSEAGTKSPSRSQCSVVFCAIGLGLAALGVIIGWSAAFIGAEVRFY